MADRIAPNPRSPFATADPHTRHIIPLFEGLSTPESGTLQITACEQLAVVPEVGKEHPVGNLGELPRGMCALCVVVARGLPPRETVLEACQRCTAVSGHGPLCAMCRIELHDEWRAKST